MKISDIVKTIKKDLLDRNLLGTIYKAQQSKNLIYVNLPLECEDKIVKELNNVYISISKEIRVEFRKLLF